MGWGNGSGKREVLDPAGGEVIVCGSDGEHAFKGKLVFIDVSGLAHKASKKDAATVVREGTSQRQRDYVTKQIDSVAAEGGRPVLVLDGRAYPPKLATRADRRQKAAAARREAEQLQQSGSLTAAQRTEMRKLWEKAAGPQVHRVPHALRRDGAQHREVGALTALAEALLSPCLRRRLPLLRVGLRRRRCPDVRHRGEVVSAVDPDARSTSLFDVHRLSAANAGGRSAPLSAGKVADGGEVGRAEPDTPGGVVSKGDKGKPGPTHPPDGELTARCPRSASASRTGHWL